MLTDVGVELAVGRQIHTVEAKVEVILCAGVFGTPQLLMLSGIGPEDRLKQHGIPVICHAPKLGENLHDHLEAHIQIETDAPISLNRYLKSHLMIWVGLQWFGWKGGIAAVSQCHVGAFLRTNTKITHPNIQFHFFPVFFSENRIPDPRKNGYRLGAGPMRPESRGTLRLRSADPNDAPLIDPNYLATDRDRYEMCEGLKLGREVLSPPAFRKFHKREDLPGAHIRTDEELDVFIRQL